MKKLLVVLLSVLLTNTYVQNANAQDVTVSFQTFYDNLSPYGEWVSDPQYGNVWVPNEGGDFRPYGSRGHWVMTDYGNTWMSDDPWGWACYHYGRWVYDPYYGWVWIPGYEWAPAWVTWRFGGGHCGWAPLGPGMGLGVAVDIPISWWIFVGPEYMYRPNCISYWRGPSYNQTYYHQTTIINNYYVDNRTHVRYNYGPRPEAIQQVTHQPVQVYHVQQMNRPGAPRIGGNAVSIYRPQVNRATVSSARPATVIPAPRQIGRPQAAPALNPGRQPEFRQQLQRGAIPGAGPQRGVPNNQQQRNQPQMERPQPQRGQPPVDRNMQQRNQPQMERPQPQREQPQMERPQPQRGQPQMERPVPQRAEPQMERPQPQRGQPQMERPQPMPQRAQPQMERPQPPRPQPQMERPQPQRPQPQMERPQPPRPQPQMERPQPQRPQPQMERPQPPRPQPQMERPQPMPQRAQPPMERSQPPRPQPQMERQQPQMNRPQPAPQPRQQPNMEAPRQGPPPGHEGRR
jgi:hypothetical protein